MRVRTPYRTVSLLLISLLVSHTPLSIEYYLLDETGRRDRATSIARDGSLIVHGRYTIYQRATATPGPRCKNAKVHPTNCNSVTALTRVSQPRHPTASAIRPVGQPVAQKGPPFLGHAPARRGAGQVALAHKDGGTRVHDVQGRVLTVGGAGLVQVDDSRGTRRAREETLQL